MGYLMLKFDSCLIVIEKKGEKEIEDKKREKWGERKKTDKGLVWSICLTAYQLPMGHLMLKFDPCLIVI